MDWMSMKGQLKCALTVFGEASVGLLFPIIINGMYERDKLCVDYWDTRD